MYTFSTFTNPPVARAQLFGNLTCKRTSQFPSSDFHEVRLGPMRAGKATGAGPKFRDVLHLQVSKSKFKSHTFKGDERDRLRPSSGMDEHFRSVTFFWGTWERCRRAWLSGRCDQDNRNQMWQWREALLPFRLAYRKREHHIHPLSHTLRIPRKVAFQRLLNIRTGHICFMTSCFSATWKIAANWLNVCADWEFWGRISSDHTDLRPRHRFQDLTLAKLQIISPNWKCKKEKEKEKNVVFPGVNANQQQPISIQVSPNAWFWFFFFFTILFVVSVDSLTPLGKMNARIKCWL